MTSKTLKIAVIVALAVTVLPMPKAQAFDPVTMAILMPMAMRVASAAQPQIIRGLTGGGKCLMKMGKDVYQIGYLPYGMGKMIFWGPFGGFRSGAVYTMKGVIAPGKLVVHTLLFPYMLFGGSLNI